MWFLGFPSVDFWFGLYNIYSPIRKNNRNKGQWVKYRWKGERGFAEILLWFLEQLCVALWFGSCTSREYSEQSIASYRLSESPSSSCRVYIFQLDTYLDISATGKISVS